MKANNLIGKKFNLLTVISRAKNESGRVRWLCKCKCGKVHIVRAHNLISNLVKSCGCLRHFSNCGTPRKFPVTEEIFLTNKFSDLKYYLLGAYMSDGCITGKYFSISSKDLDWLELIRDIISPFRVIPKQKNSNNYCLSIHHKKIVEWFKQNNCVPKKSLILEFPNIPKKYLRDFFRGFHDGDGSVSVGFKTYRRYPYLNSTLYSASRTFLIQAQKILNNLGFNAKLYLKKDNRISVYIKGKKIKKNCIMSTIHFVGNKAIEFLNWMYYPTNKLSMPRKLEIVKKANKIYKLWNKRQNKRLKMITFRGETLHIAEWSRRINISVNVISYRIGIGGWSIEEALTTPVGSYNKK